MTNSKYAPLDLNATAGFYEQYYNQQHGNGLSVFKGRRHMDGDGLGNLFGRVFCAVVPKLAGFGKHALKSVGKQALNLAKDALEGEDIGQSAMRRLKATGADIIEDMNDDLNYPKRRAKPQRRRPSKRQKGGSIFDD